MVMSSDSIDAPVFGKESAVYNLLEQYPSSPYSLDACLRRNQLLHEITVLKVLRVEDRRLVERWAAELCAAVAWVESLGLAHTDLRPPNLLLNERNHLKLTDIDCVARIRESLSGNPPRWARLYNDPVTGHGCHGVDGPETEQSAIGSLLYCMTRGHEPYWQPEGVPRSTLWNYLLDCIIGRCWNGWYESIKKVAEAGTHSRVLQTWATPRSSVLSIVLGSERRCCRLLQEGLLNNDEAQ
ncbi:hypothetical protein N657DRAFT_659236 [Parathielavia appendiculata]|uniref:Protein kinase domain-containing protein n=1 Tax=Parathielavia appendiculata TaxID=2587402 RepID=A0AAN6YYP7_9PEZI|nr:hypothetical protein N657DRAFT_659236 [Parathielavia appendiculata]